MSKTEEEFKKIVDKYAHENIYAERDTTFSSFQPSKLLKLLKSQGFIISQWRPINDAPKNVPVLVKFKNRAGMDRIVKAFYAKKFTLTYEGDCEEWADYDESSGECYAPEGWYEDVYGDHECENLNSEEITHFMPLPPSPEGEEKKITEGNSNND